jgi:hypothetical protein
MGIKNPCFEELKVTKLCAALRFPVDTKQRSDQRLWAKSKQARLGWKKPQIWTDADGLSRIIRADLCRL